MYTVSVTDSIKDILMTPIGSRVCLPEYGSRLHLLLDRRVDEEFKTDLVRYVYDAVTRWEKRIKLDKITGISLYDGCLSFTMRFADGNKISFHENL